MISFQGIFSKCIRYVLFFDENPVRTLIVDIDYGVSGRLGFHETIYYMDYKSKIAKQEYRQDRENWLMDDTSIEIIQDVFETNPDFPFMYQFHLNYQMSIFEWLHDGRNHEKDIEKYFKIIAQKESSHLKLYAVKNQDWEKPHFHIAVLSEKPIDCRRSVKLWKHGKPAYQVVKPYEPNNIFETISNDNDGGLFKYMYRHHKTASTRWETYCPCKSNPCRKGRCPHQ